MKFFLKKFRNHWPTLVLAVIVGLIYVSHHFFIAAILSEQGEVFHPVTIGSNRDEGAFYGPRANAVFEGQLLAGDISVSGNEASPWVLPILNPILMGGLGKILGSLEAGFIFSDFLFPFLIFIALYFLAFTISDSRLFGILFAVIFIFLPKLFLNIPPVSLSSFKDSLEPILPGMNDQLYFSRFEYPKMTFLFFTLAFLFLFKTLKKGGKYNLIFTGLFFGVMFYTYLYDWIYFAIGLGLIGLFFLIKKNFHQVKRIAIIVAIGLVISIPYWINFISLQSLPHYNDLFSRIGVEIGNELRIVTAWKTYLRAGALAFIIWLLFRKKDKILANYISAFLLVIFIVLNLQVFLGFNPQPDHWHRVQFLIVAIAISMIGFWIFKRYFSRLDVRIPIIAGMIIMLFMAVAVFNSQYSFAKNEFKRYTINKDYNDSYQWLNKNTPKNSVVGSISLLANSETPLFTDNKLFLPNGFNTTVSNKELWKRFMEISRIYGIKVDKFSELAQDSGILLYLFHDKYRDRSFDSYFRESGRKLPAEVRDEKINEYRKFLKSPEISFQLDYLIFGPREGKIGKGPINIIPSLEEVYNKNRIKIYKFKLSE